MKTLLFKNNYATKPLGIWVAFAVLLILLSSCGISINPSYASSEPTSTSQVSASIDTSSTSLPEETGTYTTKEDVALYIHCYGKLPSNFITKQEAQKLGWNAGSLEPYAPDKCIGGNPFGNYEGLLPAAEGRTFTECDIDTLGASSRGAKRMVYSNDGLIYYTDDHYESFTKLYGDEES